MPVTRIVDVDGGDVRAQATTCLTQLRAILRSRHGLRDHPVLVEVARPDDLGVIEEMESEYLGDLNLQAVSTQVVPLPPTRRVRVNIDLLARASWPPKRRTVGGPDPGSGGDGASRNGRPQPAFDSRGAEQASSGDSPGVVVDAADSVRRSRPGVGVQGARAEIRSIEALRVGWGLACLAAPALVIRVLGGRAPDRRAVVVTRMLGARHVVQGVASGIVPTSPVLSVGAAADLAHASSMCVLGLLDRGRRRLAFIDSAIAAGWGALSLRGRRNRRCAAERSSG